MGGWVNVHACKVVHQYTVGETCWLTWNLFRFPVLVVILTSFCLQAKGDVILKQNNWLSLVLDLRPTAHLDQLKEAVGNKSELWAHFKTESYSCYKSLQASASFTTGYFDILLCCWLVVSQRKRLGLRHALWALFCSSQTSFNVSWQQPTEAHAIRLLKCI